MRWRHWVLVGLLLAGCGSSSPRNSGSPSDAGSPDAALPACSATELAVVTDIDETLTTSDGEFIKEIADPAYDPAMRPGASDLMQDYAKRGYYIYYLTGRAKTIKVGSETATQATLDWLTKHDFPVNPSNTWLTLADSLYTGTPLVNYKAQAIEAKQSAGYKFSFAYGNATTDADSYLDAGIPKQDVFMIENAGYKGTQPVAGNSYIDQAHTVQTLQPICQF
jgi:phosphatidate phosphatase PAH1